MKRSVKAVVSVVFLVVLLQMGVVSLAGPGGDKKCVPGFLLPPIIGSLPGIDCVYNAGECINTTCDTPHPPIWIPGFCDSGEDPCDMDDPTPKCRRPSYTGMCTPASSNGGPVCDCMLTVVGGFWEPFDCPNCH